MEQEIVEKLRVSEFFKTEECLRWAEPFSCRETLAFLPPIYPICRNVQRKAEYPLILTSAVRHET